MFTNIPFSVTQFRRPKNGSKRQTNNKESFFFGKNYLLFHNCMKFLYSILFPYMVTNTYYEIQQQDPKYRSGSCDQKNLFNNRSPCKY